MGGGREPRVCEYYVKMRAGTPFESLTESSEAGFEAITLVADGKREFRVVAEFLAVL